MSSAVVNILLDSTFRRSFFFPDDDLPDHEYDYIDINQLRMCAGQSQTASTDQQDRRKSHSSINSIYGWDEKDSI